MAVKLRLQRLGNHKRPFYRVVATEAKSPRDGRFLEILGTYEPFKGDVTIDATKVKAWLDNGAQPTETVRSLLKKYDLITK